MFFSVEMIGLLGVFMIGLCVTNCWLEWDRNSNSHASKARATFWSLDGN